MTDLLSMTKPELEELMEQLGEKRFVAAQLFSWLHKQRVVSFDEMTNLSKALRDKLKKNYNISSCTIAKKLVSVYDDTVKYLFTLHDGEQIESVVMKYKYGYTICVSSQVGCKMGCTFCASGIAGFVRHLLPGEILAQVYTAARDLDVRISHIVMMGVGEPLDNFDNVLRFLQLITNENGYDLSMRNISLSTCGLVPGIRKLKEENGCDIVIVSLHWGRETYLTQSAGQVTMAKQLIDGGADVIYGHHPHVLQPMLFYQGKPIMFSTGNFTFGTMSKVDPHTGIFRFTYRKSGDGAVLSGIEVVPCQTSGSGDYRPVVLTDETEIRKTFKILTVRNVPAKCENPPEYFLETGRIMFDENGMIIPEM